MTAAVTRMNGASISNAMPEPINITEIADPAKTKSGTIMIATDAMMSVLDGKEVSLLS